MDKPNISSGRETPSGIYRWIPALDSLRGYSVGYFRRDLVAGLTVATVAVPQAMAYASIFGMPVEYGLYTAIVMTLVGALLDSSKQLINGPTNAISIAMLSALSIPILAEASAETRIAAAILMTFLIGLIQTSITFLRLGDLSRYISHAVIVGFTLGASILLVLDQMKNVFGLKAMGDPHDHFIKRFWLTMTQGGAIHLPTVCVALGTIVVALLLRQVNRRFRILLPELLISIFLAGSAVWLLGLGERGVKLIDKIPRALPGFQWPSIDWELARELLPSATAIGLLGLLEAIAMAKSIAAKTNQKLDINQQCLSEGIANLAGSVFQCIPGSGSLTRSYINHQAGAATQWSGVISAAGVAVIMLALAPLAQYIPRSALAGVLLLAAARMFDLRSVIYHCNATRFDAAIVIATAASAVLVSVEFCIMIGTLLSFLIYVPKAARVELTEMVMTPEGVIRDRIPSDPSCTRLRIYNFEGELFFGSAPEFESQLEQIESAMTDQSKIVVLRIKHLRNPDSVCIELLNRFIDRMAERDICVVLSGVREAFFDTLVRTGIVRKLGAKQVFRELSQVWSSTMMAIEWSYRQLGEHRCPSCPRLTNTGAGPDQWHFMI